MTEIVPRLFIGGVGEASNREWLETHGITHIINCAEEIPDRFFHNIRYFRLDMRDIDEDISVPLRNAYKYIYSAYAYNRTNRILIHCHTGKSRAEAVMIYFLMKFRDISFRQAVAMLEYKRKERVVLNLSYDSQLRKYDRE